MRYFMVAVLLVGLMASPALAALKMLPDDLARELEGVALDHAARELGVPRDGLEVQEAWVRELIHLGIDVYVVGITAGDSKLLVYIHVDEGTVLTEDEVEELVAADQAAAPADWVGITTLSLTDTTEDEVAAPAGQAIAYYAIGGGVLAAAAAVAMLRRRRTR